MANHEGSCRDCQYPIYWLASPSNRNTPINRLPVPDGNLVVDLVAGTWRYATAEQKADPDVKLYVAHFRDCPAAKTRRRAR